jgi:hypothetical protein
MSVPARVVYQQGDHVCTLFMSPDEQLAAAVEYIKQGLDRHERCLYVCGEQTPDEFRAALQAADIDVAGEEARGALILITKHEGHLKGGSFQPSRMIEMLHEAVRDALADGYAGLCAAGDMTWLIDNAPGSEAIAEYEARLNDFYKSNKALGLCQYNRRRLPSAVLDHCMATHQTIRISGPMLLTNPFYELPETAMKRKANPRDIDTRIDRACTPPVGV